MKVGEEYQELVRLRRLRREKMKEEGQARHIGFKVNSEPLLGKTFIILQTPLMYIIILAHKSPPRKGSAETDTGTFHLTKNCACSREIYIICGKGPRCIVYMCFVRNLQNGL